MVVGRKYTYKGQEPDAMMVEKVMKWPEYRNVSEVREFLGGRHSTKLDQRFCRDSRSIDKIDKGDEERVYLGKRTEISNEEDKEEGVDL